MADKTMPPNDPNPAPEGGQGMSPNAMASDSVMPQSQGDSVMITLPKTDFDSLHEMLNNATAMFNQLAEGVNQQQGAAQAGQPMPPPAFVPTGSNGGGGVQGGGEEDMDAFLKSISEEGNMRSK
jgi:hypothetical protein